MPYELQPVEGESHEGRQWGWRVVLDGKPVVHARTGGTGDCWNIEMEERFGFPVDGDKTPMHVCDLQALAGALDALLNSEAHKAHVARWAPARRTFEGRIRDAPDHPPEACQRVLGGDPSSKG